jgi:hypothetical protein
MNSLFISKEYLDRENRDHERNVEKWIGDYCRRNKIPTIIVDRHTLNKKWEPESYYLRIDFKSIWQQEIFVRQGNKSFPYFEFW